MTDLSGKWYGQIKAMGRENNKPNYLTGKIMARKNFIIMTAARVVTLTLLATSFVGTPNAVAAAPAISTPSKVSITSQTISIDYSASSSITISNTRATSDQPDTVTGFQIKAIYVVPSDGVDHSYDTNGYIDGILDEGNKYLRAQLGLQVPIDKNAVGYDIQFMKSRLSTAYFLTAKYLTNELLAESLALETPGINRKNYIFFIDIDILRDGGACGAATKLGMSSVVAVGPSCTGEALNFENYAASTWPHELFHNFGVDHTPDDPCDLMRGPETIGTCSWDSSLTIDKERSRYIGNAMQGQDILKLPVWEGFTGKDYWASCSLNPVPRADGVNYAYCPTGTQTIGDFRSCRSSISSATIEEFVDGTWKCWVSLILIQKHRVLKGFGMGRQLLGNVLQDMWLRGSN